MATHPLQLGRRTAHQVVQLSATPDAANPLLLGGRLHLPPQCIQALMSCPVCFGDEVQVAARVRARRLVGPLPLLVVNLFLLEGHRPHFPSRPGLSPAHHPRPMFQFHFARRVVLLRRIQASTAPPAAV